VLLYTVFPHIRPAGIINLHSLQMRVLLENTTFLLHKIVRIVGIIRVAGIIRGRALYEEIRYLVLVITILPIQRIGHTQQIFSPAICSL
jgi:hypothetical protein